MRAGRPMLASTMTFGITNPVGTQAPSALPVLVLSLLPDASGPCGTAQPSYGMNGPSFPGERLVNPATAATLFGAPWAGPGQFATFPFAVPMAPWLLQVQLYAQGLLFDPSPSATVPLGLTNAVHLTIGS